MNRYAVVWMLDRASQLKSFCLALLAQPPRIVYLSFDRFPSAKGAATHIDAFVTALGEHFGNVDLLTIPSEDCEHEQRGEFETDIESTPWERPGVRHHRITAPGPDLFQRVLSFRTQTWRWWREQFEITSCHLAGLGSSAPSREIKRPQDLPAVHFRSIFEGYPIARQKERFCNKLIYEVNGLPSIELKYHYPAVANDDELLRKLTAQEQVCLDAADLVLTVSEVNALHLVRRGVERERICVIPNGVDLETFTYQAPSPCVALDSGEPLKMLYSGTMSSWQGVSTALDALALYVRDAPATLTLVGHSRAAQKRELESYAYSLGVSDKVRWFDPVSKSELAKMHHAADVVLAPLLGNDRNLVQGCCPLKVLEAMACGTPVIASDLPVIRELATHETEVLLVRPGSGKAIKDAMFRLRSEPGLSDRLSQAARARVENRFLWQLAQQRLIQAYQSLGEPFNKQRTLDSCRDSVSD